MHNKTGRMEGREGGGKEVSREILKRIFKRGGGEATNLLTTDSIEGATKASQERKRLVSGARQIKGCLGKGKSNLQSVPPSKSFPNGDMVATEGRGFHEGRSSR